MAGWAHSPHGDTEARIARRLARGARLQQLRDAHRRGAQHRGGGGRARRRHHPVRHRRHLRRHAERGVPRSGARDTARRGGGRHEVRGDGRCPPRRRAIGVRCVARPARHRPHRPLPGAPARRRGADRGHRSAPWPSWSAAGKVREIGCSNFDGARTDAAADGVLGEGASRRSCRCRTSSACSTAGSRTTRSRSCERHGMGILPYFPLASGMLTGKFQRGVPPPEGTRLVAAPGGPRRPGLRRPGLRRRRAPDRVRRGARAHAARAGHVVAGVPSTHGLGDRGGHLGRPGAHRTRPRRRGD